MISDLIDLTEFAEFGSGDCQLRVLGQIFDSPDNPSLRLDFDQVFGAGQTVHNDLLAP